MSEMSYLKWRCRRGVKELDVILTRYLEQEFERAEDTEQAVFKNLLDLEDPILFGMLIGSEPVTNPEFVPLLDKLRSGL